MPPENDLTDEDIYLTPDEVCDWLNVKRHWLYQQVQHERIPYARLGTKMLRFNKADLRAWLKSLEGGHNS